MNKLELIISSQKTEEELQAITSIKGGKFFFNHYFKINDGFFPEENWTDFSAAIMDMWLDNLSAINSKELEFCFMEGPFLFKTKPCGNNVAISFGVEKNNEFYPSQKDIIIDKKEFVSLIKNAGKKLISLYKGIGVHENDYYLSRIMQYYV